MTFSKPKNVSYVEMCIYIDNKIQQDKITDEEASLCYQYIYLIIYMLATKKKYFHKEEYYDEFAILLAGDVFHRLFTHPKLFELDDNGQPKLPKMKSCLNYIKSILYGRKVTFEQTNYSQKYIDIEQANEEFKPIVSSFAYSSTSLNAHINTDVKIYLNDLSKTIKQYVYSNSVYRKNPILIKNIYISCILSILNSLVFTQNDLQNIQEKYVTQEAKLRYLYKMYKINRTDCTVLYHLDRTFYAYITVLVRKLFTLIGTDIKELCRESVYIPEDVLMNISLMEVAGKEIYDD